MTWVTGVDGCKAGWICACRNVNGGELHFALARDAPALLALAPRPEIVAIDIPIGLPARGARECDRAARRLLGRPRASSVFPAPIRAALAASSRAQASRITERADGRRVPAQAFGLYAKVRAIDALLAAEPDARERFREVHPELSFRAWNRGEALAAGKKSAGGRAQRLRLAERWLGAGVLERARGTWLRRDIGDDDLLDAIAALWSATRIAQGAAQTLPVRAPRDALGLRMAISY